MAISPVPVESWQAAETAYPEGGSRGARAVLAALGHEVTKDAIIRHMTSREIRFCPPRKSGGRTEPRLYIPPFDEDTEVRVVFIGDQQLPEIDWEAHKVVRSFLKHYLGGFRGPKYLVNIGDTLNATALGRFPHDADTPGMDEEITLTKRVFEDYAGECGPETEYVMIEGNHEWRLTRTLQTDPHLRGMIAPWPELLEFDRIFGKNRWHWVPYMQGFVDFCDGLLVHHGYRVSQHSAMAAKAHVENTGRSILHGHVHRLGTYYKSLYDRQLVGIENGSLCVPQSYIPGTANWQLGITYGRFFGSRFEFSQMPIIDGRGFAEGRWFPARLPEPPGTLRPQRSEPSPG